MSRMGNADKLPELSWTRDGVEHVRKLLPGVRFGGMCDELREDIEKNNGRPSERVQIIRSGDMERIRAIDYMPGCDLTTTEVREEEILVPGEEAAVPVTVYTPASGRAKLPCVLHLHGGAWMYGDRKTVRHLCRYLSEQAEAVVFSVEYRLAPEHPYPAGLSDCRAVLHFLHENAAQYGADPGNLTVSGDSAGGNFAALLSHEDRDKGQGFIKKQVLFYPALAVNDAERDPDCSFSLRDYIYDDSQRPMIEPRIMSIYMAGKGAEKAYLQGRASIYDPAVSPFFDTDFAGLPDTLLLSAQYDYLTRQGEVYARKLAAAGTRVRMVIYAGVFHGFSENLGDYPQTEDSVTEAAKFIRGE